MYRTFKKYIQDKKLCLPTEKILLAVSGGVDSMVMFALFREAGYNIGVAHCNFSLRGEESDTETELVKKVCKDNNVPIHYIRFDTYAVMQERGISLEMAARDLRYSWFEECCEKHGYTKIGIAHNLNDSVETFFINSVRGTGIRGLSGISIVRDKIIRPLSSFSRKEIEAYAQEKSISYLNDSSNSTIVFLRNKFRHIILPQIEGFSKNYLKTMGKNMERISQSVDFIDSAIENIRQKVTIEKKEYSEILLNRIQQKNFAFILHELLSKYSFNSSVIEEISFAYSKKESSLWFISACYTGYLDGEKLLLKEKNKSEIKFLTAENLGSSSSFSFEIDVLERSEIKDLKVSKNVALLDFNKISFPLKFRHWKDGDTFVPFGMKGRKKIGDYMTDAKVNVFQRSGRMVLECKIGEKQEIIWLSGERISDLTRVDAETTQILKISML
ncbi:MAG: tRNA lysidine(34) synthetase TilS [Bacteroidetes bacterium]|nr:tRNA lysidine(34) synthetase TilS [Bacteroidota bacterium]